MQRPFVSVIGPDLAGASPDPYLAACPSRALLARVGEKWATLALAELAAGPRRFAELMRRLQGVSQKMLTQTLRNLERDGLISRTLVCDRPIQVRYALTDRGQSLAPVLNALTAWARTHYLDVRRSQQDYDATPSAAGTDA
ncbi:MAG: helix-turn-helix domain-containing protein [Lysobacterales bacterium]